MNTSGFVLFLKHTFFRFILIFLDSFSHFISNYNHLKTISANPSPTRWGFKCAILHFVVGLGKCLCVFSRARQCVFQLVCQTYVGHYTAVCWGFCCCKMCSVAISTPTWIIVLWKYWFRWTLKGWNPSKEKVGVAQIQRIKHFLLPQNRIIQSNLQQWSKS